MPWPSLMLSSSSTRTLHRKLVLLSRRLCLLVLPLSSVLTAPAVANDTLPVAGARPAGSQQELRTLLSTSHKIDPRQNETRRLDPDERQAIRRDIREAMRGAYPEPGPSAVPTSAKPRPRRR